MTLMVEEHEERLGESKEAVSGLSPEGEWYAVRQIVHHVTLGVYEERIVLQRADSEDEAIELASEDERDYVSDLGAGTVGLGLYQSYHMYDPPASGAEVYSLMRESDLEPDAYLDRFFTTGAERTRTD
jgi:hypothetical protein